MIVDKNLAGKKIGHGQSVSSGCKRVERKHCTTYASVAFIEIVPILLTFTGQVKK